MVRDCGLLWTVFSGEGLWLTVDSFQWWGTVAHCGHILVVIEGLWLTVDSF